MKSYILKPKSVKISQIKEKEFSLSSFSFYNVNFKNNNIKKLSEICIENKKGFEPGSSQYIDFSENYFIRISEMSDLNFTFGINNDTKKIKPVNGKNIINKGDLCYQTASNVGNVCFYNGPKAYYNSHIRKLKFENNFYIFSFLKSNFCKEQVSISGSIKGVDNFKSELLENIKIPFPSKSNHENPQNIEKLVSLITQNIIDKEEQIKLKNEKIDEIIEKELLENQKINNYNYSFPRISEVKAENRIDTGLYERDYKGLKSLIENYENGNNKISELGFKTKKGPNLAISVIGESIYSDIKNNINFKQLILSKHISEEGSIKIIQYIGNNVDLPTLKQYDIMLFARGDIGRVIFIDDFLIGATSNFDVFFITSKLPYYKNIFLLNYFKYLKSIKFWKYFGVGGSGAPSLTDYFLKKLDIPLFPTPKQQEIAKLYYNKVEIKDFLSLQKQEKINLKTYLETEKLNNKNSGIFQLNMELFKLKEILENIIDKIIMDEKIEISFE